MLFIPPFHKDGALAALSLKPQISKSAVRAPTERTASAASAIGLNRGL